MSRRIIIQLVVLGVIAVVGGAVMVFGYIKLPGMFGVGRYQVTVELPYTAGLYPSGNVTYRGVKVGRVKSVRLTETGVAAVLSLNSDTDIPSDLDAQVHSQSAVGEQYVALMPRGDSPPLKNGDVIRADRVSVPSDLDSALDEMNAGLATIPHDDLKTLVDEAYIAVGGLGPEISRLVTGTGALAADAHENLESLLLLIDESGPVLDAQVDSADSIQQWAANLAAVSQQLQGHDADLRGVLQQGGPVAEETRALFDRLRPTLPIVLANLVSVGEVAVTYQPSLEQLLVLLPQAAATAQAVGVANRNTKQDYAGVFLSFNLRLNLPPPCTTGFLPAQQQRAAALEDHPDRPAGDLYCRVPQDSPLSVRGVRNTPCVTRPGKRAPTVAMCESDENYVPLNDGYNWKGDPNATLSGQPVPQVSPPVSVPIPAAEYDPQTGSYIGPDGRVYTQSDLSEAGGPNRTWQSMLIPPGTG